MLFYFEDAASREPVGVIILEGCAVELVEAAEEFAFAVRFAGSRARTYVLVAESQAAMEGWVKALSRASFDYLRVVVRELEQQLAAVRAGGGPPPAHRPRALPSLPSKENGCAVWNAETPAASASVRANPSSRPRPRAPAAAASPAGLSAQRASRFRLLRPAARVVRPGGQGAEEPVAQQPGPALRSWGTRS
nr:PREDICTED: sesquipedalian-1 [Bos indicus]